MQEQVTNENASDRPGDWSDAGASQGIDPVCGMQVNLNILDHPFGHKGRIYHFCSSGCRAKFAADPDSYLNTTSDASEPKQDGVLYACPIHPQIRQSAAGYCPMCGMTLDPLLASATVECNRELTNLMRRFWVGLVLTLPLLILAMGDHIPGLGFDTIISPAISTWIQFGLCTPVVLWAGWPLFQRGWASLASRHLDLFTLLSFGTATAYLYSLAATVVPDRFPAGFRMMGRTIPVYFEPIAIVTVLALLGLVLELRGRERTGGALRDLFNLSPKFARHQRSSGHGAEIPLSDVKVGELHRVRPGDATPPPRGPAPG